ncbi:hypothetical protein MOSL_1905 [Moraxella osloensis]|nr:hypothetical protein MOSL_1905 [Moraxella osloensis]
MYIVLILCSFAHPLICAIIMAIYLAKKLDKFAILGVLSKNIVRQLYRLF